jgi:hypothetical protein
MYFYKAFGLNIHSEIVLPELSDGDFTPNADLFIRLADLVLPALKNTKIHRRSVKASFGQNDEKELFLHWKGIAAFKATNGNLLLVSPETVDQNLISLFTVSEALGLILFQRGYFLLHASSVMVGDEAWCFMGAPGAGKSTTAAAFIKAGCKLLSDDLTAIDFDSQGVAWVIPAYPQLKIWDKTVDGLVYDKASLQPVSEGVNKFSYQPKTGFQQEPVKLKAFYFLHKARNKKPLLPLSGPEIPIETLKNFPLPISLLNEESLKKHFLQSFQCAKSAAMWQKKRPEGFEKLEKWVHETVSEVNVPMHA